MDSQKKINLANLLTMARMAMVLPIAYFLSGNDPRSAFFALILFSIASLTDLLDGMAARMQGMVTKFGIFLDPLADKVLTISVFLVFSIQSIFPLWMFWVILAREIAVTLLRSSKVEKYSPTFVAKSKTAIQMLVIVFIIFAKWQGWLSGSFNTEKIIYFLMLGVIIITVFSGLEYMFMMMGIKYKK